MENKMRMSDIGKYRNEALDGYTYNDLINYGFDDSKEDLIPKSVVENVIDNTQCDINEIKNMLVCIEGLSEVDEIKEKLNELSEKLY